MTKHDKAQDKTNAMRMFDAAGLPHEVLFYDAEAAVSGAEVAAALGQDSDQVFKTLVTIGKSGEHYVFMVPVEGELNLKKAASAAGEKSIAMIKSRELLPLTGYIRGGCTPIGMKKPFPTYIHESCLNYPYIYISAGQRGLQLKLDPNDLIKEVHAEVCILFHD